LSGNIGQSARPMRREVDGPACRGGRHECGRDRVNREIQRVKRKLASGLHLGSVQSIESLQIAEQKLISARATTRHRIRAKCCACFGEEQCRFNFWRKSAASLCVAAWVSSTSTSRAALEQWTRKSSRCESLLLSCVRRAELTLDRRWFGRASQSTRALLFE
jgi:hypothetical protein